MLYIRNFTQYLLGRTNSDRPRGEKRSTSPRGVGDDSGSTKVPRTQWTDLLPVRGKLLEGRQQTKRYAGVEDRGEGKSCLAYRKQLREETRPLVSGTGSGGENLFVRQRKVDIKTKKGAEVWEGRRGNAAFKETGNKR